MKNNKCKHGKSICPECSAVKMVAYGKTFDKIVWYSGIFYDKKAKGNKKLIAQGMKRRFFNKYGNVPGATILFYDNKTKNKINL